MPVNPQLVRLDAELADLEQQLQAVDDLRNLSDGEKVLLRGGLGHRLRKKHLEREIREQVYAMEAHERAVGGARKHYCLRRIRELKEL